MLKKLVLFLEPVVIPWQLMMMMMQKQLFNTNNILYLLNRINSLQQMFTHNSAPVALQEKCSASASPAPHLHPSL